MSLRRARFDGGGNLATVSLTWSGPGWTMPMLWARCELSSLPVTMADDEFRCGHRTHRTLCRGPVR